MILAHEQEAVGFLFLMIKRYFEYSPEMIKPQRELDNSTVLYFNSPEGMGLDSAIRVGAAAKHNLGSGQTIHYLHLSEAAKYPPHLTKALLTSLLQTVPAEQGTEVIFESTANGRSGEFYRRFTEARFTYEIFLNKEGKPEINCTVNNNANE